MEINFDFREEKSGIFGPILRPVAEVTLINGNKEILESAYVDSGADVTLIPKSVGDILGLAVGKNETITEIKGVGERGVPIIIKKVKLKIGEKEIEARVAWALIEETLKYLMAAIFILWRRAVDEAPDYVIYMITIALGFASAENMLFLIAPLSDGNFANGFFTGDIRFLGATLLHVVASAAIGFALAFSAKYRPLGRVAAAALGLILAIALHAAFNMLIINQGASTALAAFFFVWVTAVIFFAAFEVLKYFQYRNLSNNNP